MNILVTGGCGFIFSNFIRYILNKYPTYRIINFDLLTYAGRLENTDDFRNNPRYLFIKGDVCDKRIVERLVREVDWVVHAAAESHVDRSIVKPDDFLRTNIWGTYTLLEAAKKYGIKRFIQIGTDEEYGSIKDGCFRETDALNPSSPYSSSKAAASLLALAYFTTFGLPVIVSRSSNNFGPYQFPEKLIPLFITNLLENKKAPLYGDGGNIRDWLYVWDNCAAIDYLFHFGQIGEVYNIAAGNEKNNLEITRLILEKLNRDESWIEYVADRPGHDRRYAIDSSKINLGWRPKFTFEEAMDITIDWYISHQDWWRKIKRGK